VGDRMSNWRCTMVFPFPKDENPVSYYNLGVAIVWPNLMLFTRQNWLGQENLGQPGEGIVVGANHMSWFDPAILLHFVNDAGRPARVLAKDALLDLPVVGRIVRGAGTIPVHRETSNAGHAVSSAVDAVSSGEVVFVYPEGTITRDPQLWPMTGKTGAARIALLSGKPLIPIAHWGVQKIMGPYKKELNLFPRKTMHVIAGRPVDLDDLRVMPVNAAVLEEATTRLMDDITALEAQLRGEDPPLERWNRKAGKRLPVLHGVTAYEKALGNDSDVDPGGSDQVNRKTSGKRPETEKAGEEPVGPTD
jgi:1-acyl-sn-glycerol-3-phosphate acyltransferase